MLEILSRQEFTQELTALARRGGLRLRLVVHDEALRERIQLLEDELERQRELLRMRASEGHLPSALYDENHRLRDELKRAKRECA